MSNPLHLGLCVPLTPVCGVNFDLPFGCCIHPSTDDTAAWKGQSMGTVPFDDGQLEVAIKRR